MPDVIGPLEGPVTDEWHIAKRGGRGATLRGLRLLSRAEMSMMSRRSSRHAFSRVRKGAACGWLLGKRLCCVATGVATSGCRRGGGCRAIERKRDPSKEHTDYHYYCHGPRRASDASKRGA